MHGRPGRCAAMLAAVCLGAAPLAHGQSPEFTRSHGAVVRLDTRERNIHLVFTGHEFADGGDTIRAVLRRQRIRASFFFTGEFLRSPAFAPLIRGLRADGNDIGPHSDKHLLYCSWEKRDSLLVNRTQFLRDLDSNMAALAAFGIEPSAAHVFLPPYEWYNDSIAAWSLSAGLQLVNFTPGTSSNADYTWPALGRSYVPSDTILSRILGYEATQTSGLNGFILLLHVGVDPRRTDRFSMILDWLITELRRRGYAFRLLSEALPPVH